MTEKVCVVTGANSGIGKVTATELARSGARVVMVARDSEKSFNALAEIKQRSTNTNIELVAVDLSSKTQLQHACKQIRASCKKVDILINNAALWSGSRQESEDGLELNFAVNHMAPFVLTNQLLGLLGKSDAARIVNVSADMHWLGRVNFDNLQLRKGYAGILAYASTKLLNLIFHHELSRRLRGGTIHTYALHPGIISTGLIRSFPKMVQRLTDSIFLTPEQGAEGILYLATSAEVSQDHGKYYRNKKEARTSKTSRDPEIAQRLWQLSEELIA